MPSTEASPLEVIFFGTPDFAVPTLRTLARDDRLQLRLVVTQPERPAGRSRRLTPPAVARAAAGMGLPLWQPESLRDAAIVERLRALNVDLFIVVAYAAIFRRALLELPRCGCLNVHPSLLPRYRGSSPIQAAIVAGDAETGVSLIQMVRRLDAGPILAQRSVPLSGEETGGSLGEMLARLAADLVPQTCVDWCAGRLTPQSQDESLASYTTRLRKEDGLIDWRQDSHQIGRLIRAMAPWPGAWARLDGRRVVVERGAPVENAMASRTPGDLFQLGNAVVVSCGTGLLQLSRVRPEGRASLDALEWIRGLRAGDGPSFELP